MHHILIRRHTAAYNIMTIYQVQVTCCETTHGACKKEAIKKWYTKKQDIALQNSNLRPHTLKACKLPSNHPLSYYIL